MVIPFVLVINCILYSVPENTIQYNYIYDNNAILHTENQILRWHGLIDFTTRIDAWVRRARGVALACVAIAVG